MNILTLKNHPTLQEYASVDELCAPLKHLDITTFSHLQVSPDNKLSVLCNHPRSLINYMQKKYYEADPCVNIQRETTDCGEYLVWDSVQCQGKTAEMLADSTRLDYRHVFTIIKKHQQFTHFYHFGTHLIYPSIHDLYINNLDLLDRFILYFNDKVHTSKSLSNAYNIKLNSEQTTHCVAVDSHQIFNTNWRNKREKCIEAMLGDSISNLTWKELECAQLLIQGKTAKEIAKILGLSFRTIEGRVERLKDKLQCSDRSTLITKILQILSPYRI